MSIPAASSLSLGAFNPPMSRPAMPQPMPSLGPASSPPSFVPAKDHQDKKEESARLETAAKRALSPISSFMSWGPFIPDMSLLSRPLASMAPAPSAARRDPKDEKEPAPSPQAVAALSPSPSPAKPKCLSFSLKGKKHPETPSYLPVIVSGNAHELLCCDKGSSLNFGKKGSDLYYFGECNCTGMDRIKNPVRKCCFDEFIKTRCSFVANRGEGGMVITHFGPGYLFGPFVQLVQLIDDLHKSGWKGSIVINFIDSQYKEGIENKLIDKDHPFLMKTIKSFRREIARILPEGIEVDMLFFFDQSDFVKRDIQFDCLVAADIPEEAMEDWDAILEAANEEDSYVIELRKDILKNKDHCIAIVAKHDGKIFERIFALTAEEIATL